MNIHKKVLSTLIVIIIALLLLAYIILNDLDIESIAHILTIISITAAAIFFCYKIWTGWFIINLSLKLGYNRGPLDDVNDNLVINIFLIKGSNDSLWIKDIQFSVSQISPKKHRRPMLSNSFIIEPIGIKRIEHSTINSEKWDEDFQHPLNLSPGEEVTFAAYIVVPKNAIVSIEALVTGNRPLQNIQDGYSGPIQWKSSTICLPNKPI